MRYYSSTLVVCVVLGVVAVSPAARGQSAEIVPLYGLFEATLENTTPYDNPFADVELNATFTSPSGRVVGFSQAQYSADRRGESFRFPKRPR